MMQHLNYKDVAPGRNRHISVKDSKQAGRFEKPLSTGPNPSSTWESGSTLLGLRVLLDPFMGYSTAAVAGRTISASTLVAGNDGYRHTSRRPFGTGTALVAREHGHVSGSYITECRKDRREEDNDDDEIAGIFGAMSLCATSL
jgi:hypothetical protein